MLEEISEMLVDKSDDMRTTVDTRKVQQFVELYCPIFLGVGTVSNPFRDISRSDNVKSNSREVISLPIRSITVSSTTAAEGFQAQAANPNAGSSAGSRKDAGGEQTYVPPMYRDTEPWYKCANCQAMTDLVCVCHAKAFCDIRCQRQGWATHKHYCRGTLPKSYNEDNIWTIRVDWLLCEWFEHEVGGSWEVFGVLLSMIRWLEYEVMKIGKFPGVSLWL